MLGIFFRIAVLAGSVTMVFDQAAPRPPLPAPIEPPRAAAIEKIDATTYRIGEMRVDKQRRLLEVPGSINDVTVLEFVANTIGGAKAYESAITLNTNAISFNTALILLGLDPSRGKPSPRQFDPVPPSGDPVELKVTWDDGGRRRTVNVEELLFDQRSKKTLPPGPWVYTGSTFLDGTRFLAELDGVLIGLMHGPQAIIDNPRDSAVGGYNFVVLNPSLGLKPGTPVTLVVQSLLKD